ncbi:MAG: GTP cyclohydrolase I FolE [Oligoflexia bacterium]|nr:GTP cyclohydrolase I FolE [Oligoflexia bacterium]
MNMPIEDILKNVRPTPWKENGLSEEDKVEQISNKFQEIMEILGLDLTNDSLKDTPKRVAKMYVKELFKGLTPENFPKITVIENEMLYDQMVLVKDISIVSLCEHHFQTIHGTASIAYIPSHGVIGLSKINRIADYFSRRPQVQERLTKQIADCLSYVLKTKDVAVYIKAKHYCVISRGVEDVNSETVTSDLRGVFKTQPDTRKEFLHSCLS